MITFCKWILYKTLFHSGAPCRLFSCRMVSYTKLSYKRLSYRRLILVCGDIVIAQRTPERTRLTSIPNPWYDLQML